jgi:hypothetical protein
MEESVQLKNPIGGGPVDEVIGEKEARKRGYFDLQFILRHLEDDNEFVKFFVVEGKKIIVQLEKPYLQYKKSTQINHERILSSPVQTSVIQAITAPSCSMDDEGCVSCGS